MSELPSFHTTQALIEEFRNGRMVILVDDESRENEGTSSSPRSTSSRTTSTSWPATRGASSACR